MPEGQREFMKQLADKYGVEKQDGFMGLLGLSQGTVSRLFNDIQIRRNTVIDAVSVLWSKHGKQGVRREDFLLATGFKPNDVDLRWDEEHFGPKEQTSNQADVEKLHASTPLTVALGSEGVIPYATEPMFGKRVRLDHLPWPRTTEGVRPMPENAGAEFLYEVLDDALEPGAHKGELLHIRITTSHAIGEVHIASIKEGDGTRLICERLEAVREDDGESILCFERTESPADILGLIVRVAKWL